MKSSIKNYAVATNVGSMFATERKRISALTGVVVKAVNNPSASSDAGLPFTTGYTMDSAILRQSILSLKLFVLRYMNETHVVLMTDESYQMIRRPEITKLSAETVESLIREVAQNAGRLRITRELSNEGIIPVHVALDTIDLASELSAWLTMTDNKTGLRSPNVDARWSGASKEELRLYDNGISWALAGSDPAALRVLACVGLQSLAVRNVLSWPLASRSTWEEVKRIGSDQMSINELAAKVDGMSAIL